MIEIYRGLTKRVELLTYDLDMNETWAKHVTDFTTKPPKLCNILKVTFHTCLSTFWFNLVVSIFYGTKELHGASGAWPKSLCHTSITSKVVFNEYTTCFVPSMGRKILNLTNWMFNKKTNHSKSILILNYNFRFYWFENYVWQCNFLTLSINEIDHSTKSTVYKHKTIYDSVDIKFGNLHLVGTEQRISWLLRNFYVIPNRLV